jgi:hypothetical protein
LRYVSHRVQSIIDAVKSTWHFHVPVLVTVTYTGIVAWHVHVPVVVVGRGNIFIPAQCGARKIVN